MLTIQEVGTQILNKEPKHFYIFGGSEWGVKSRYISILKECYSSVVEAGSVSEVLNMMKQRHIIPLVPTLYIIRYDEEFVSKLNDKSQSSIESLNIVGTVVCIYESDKHVSKCVKYLPNYTVSIDPVNPVFIQKYLTQDNPKLAPDVIQAVMKYSVSYGQAALVSRTLSEVSDNIQIDVNEISQFFIDNSVSTDEQIQIGIASRNLSYLLDVLSRYESDISNIFYVMMQTAIELDKCLTDSRRSSSLREYSRFWSYSDVYYLFTYAYTELQRSRSSGSVDVYNRVLYVLGVIQFSPIPDPEALI